MFRVLLFVMLACCGQAGAAAAWFGEPGDTGQLSRDVELLERLLDTREIERSNGVNEDGLTEIDLIGNYRQTSNSKTASLAVDGDESTCSSTLNSRDPWWAVFLPSFHCIKKIQIVNTADETRTNMERMKAFALPKAVSLGTAPFCDTPVTAEQASVPGGTISFTCDTPQNASVIVIAAVELPIAISLHLCEVRAWELPMKACEKDECESNPCKNGATCVDGFHQFSCTCAAGFTGTMCEIDVSTVEPGQLVIVGKPTWQSSTYIYKGTPLASSLAVDGNTNTEAVKGMSCSHTIRGNTNPWWYVDLGESHNIKLVKMVNRADSGASGRLAGARVYVETQLTNPIQKTDLTNICGSPVTVEQAEVPGATVPVECDQPINGRYIAIAIPRDNAILQLCEVMVWEDIDECKSSPCKNGAACVDGVNQFTCTCAAGFTGPTCETDIDECKGDPCKNGGTCTHGVDTFACKCVPGYTGTTCETDIDECQSSPCKNGATCVDGVDQFTCTCAAGFTGTMCEIDLSTVEPGLLMIVGKPTGQSSTYIRPDLKIPLVSSLAVDGNTNTDAALGKSCSHTDGENNPWWYVDLGDTRTIKTVKMVNRGDSHNSGRLAGALVFVETVLPDPLDILELTNVCGSAVTLEQAKVAGATVPVECDPPINGRYVVIGIPRNDAILQLCEVMVWEDIDECKPNPCTNGATCVNGIDKFTCTCATGFTGPTCETDINECKGDPCKNGGTCTHGVDTFACKCVAGYTGTTCETDIDDCEPSPCKNGGTCVDAVDQFTCTCVAGFAGPTCETDIDECIGDPCKNGGTCTHGVDTFTCKCVPGYTGTTCETDIDECKSNPCKNGAACVNRINQFTCTCAAGFTGPTCMTDIDECESSPCKNGATCVDGVNQFTCTCAAGFTGPTCETDIDECKGDPCKNGATCTHGVDTFACKCEAGYTGKTCETDINECETKPCKNGGICEHGVDTFSCKCPAGFSGTTCETDIDECKSDPCKNGGTCTHGVDRFTCKCAAGFTGTTCESDINDCRSIPCQHGICVDKANSFTCQCSLGYEGESCEINIDECKSGPCQHGGECIDGIEEVTCICPSGFTGVLCETNEIPPPLSLPQLPSSGGIQVSAIQLHLSVEYCIRKVVVHTRGDCTSDRLTGAVVRGGRSPFGMFNGICGIPLTAKRALEQRSFIDFICDPPLSANYIAVDMPSIHISMQLCEITIQESTPGPC